MTRPNDPLFDPRIADWLEEDPRQAPGSVLGTVLAALPSVRQRRASRVPWGFTTGPASVRWSVAAAAVIVVLAAGGAFFVSHRAQPAVIGGPSQTPGASANPTEPASPAPSATAVAQPKPAVFVINKGTGSSAECGNDGRGGCIPRLWVANLDGTGAHELLPDQSGCQRVQAWSPDGARLLFSRSECSWHGDSGMTGFERFYLTDASGSQPQLVDTGCVSPCLSEDDAVFSSDGQRVLFVRTVSVPVPASATLDPMGKPVPPTEKRVLASIDVATGRVTELGDFDTCDQCGTQWPRSYPVWSPDRTQIVFTSGAPFPPDPRPTAPAVLVADADGRNAHQVSAFGQVPAWSPDGARIVFQGTRYSWTGSWFPGKVVRSTSDIYTVRPDGTGVQRSTTDGLSYLPAWSVDGRIWFVRGGDGTATTNWVMDADGGNAAQSSLPPQPQELATTAVQPAP